MKERINEFWNKRRFAVVGVSRSGKGFGALAYRAMNERGFEVYPVNAGADEVLGERCYRSLAVLPQEPEAVLVVVPAPAAERVIRECALLGIHNVWLQQGSESEAGIRLGDELGVDLVHHACALMFMPRTGFAHAFHRFVNDLLGIGPR